ncbi:septation ring formation regulator EzrA [Paenibacillus sp. CAA11]|uniref:FtsB family cell division protein n=1 Tax=Paenibacillus sp. CAA11 TaxID=1532905 RepID=UPI000D3B5A46|nr:septum formation initiator family protein [Paenibacillus sp. CAA11]AWB42824.1 septation ring formation regulator EzrA [Paenibacillus sp. CAA11]
MRAAASRSGQNSRNSKDNSGAKRRLKLWLAVVIIFIGWAIYMFIAQSGDIHEKSLQLAQTKQNLTISEQNLEQMKYEINRLKDPEYIGQIARKKYGLYQPWEIPIHKAADGN